MDKPFFDSKSYGFTAFRSGWPTYTASFFKDKVEIVTDGKGKIIGVTNPKSLLWAKVPDSAEEIQIIEIGEKAFSECKTLRTISFSSNLEYVAPFAFWGCDRLEEIIFTSEDMDFGEGVFSASGLRNFVFPNKCTYIPSRFFQDCKNLVSVTLPQKMKEMGTMAFAGTKSLRSIDLGFNLKEISDGAFMGSGIESISIPRSVRRIGVSAFSHCLSLETIWYDGSSEDFRSLQFGMHWNRGMNKNAILYVKDKNGGWYNAFEERREDKTETVNKNDSLMEKYLKVLGLETLPTREVLNECYRTEARKFHPDVISSYNLAPEYIEFASNRFREIHEAYIELIKIIDKK